MAHTTGFDSRPSLSLTPPRQISKDVQVSENPIPLSPQWLLPKPGDNKLAMGPGENNFSPHSMHGRSEMTKLPENCDEVADTQKKKDVFRPSLLDMETGRRDRWRDEERDTNSSIRKDRWRDFDRELGDTRKTERWENSARSFGELRRAPSGRWTDSGSRDNNSHEQRRDSKWSTHWGPDDKAADGSREKWMDSGKNGDVPNKGLVPLGNNRKDEDHLRPWRPSSLQGRSRGEPPHHQTPTNRHVPAFSYGRGSGENDQATFPLGQARNSSVGSSFDRMMPTVVTDSEKGDSVHGDSATLRYSRTKLLDIYRMTDVSSLQNIGHGITLVPSLTLEEVSGPLALCSPNPEEMVVLKGIDKGEIVTSGAPQISKDGSVGRNLIGFSQSRQPKIESKEDVPIDSDDVKIEVPQGSSVKFPEVLSHEKQHSKGSSSRMENFRDPRPYCDAKFKTEAFGEDGDSRKANDGIISRESISQGNNSAIPVSAWRASVLGDRSHSSSNDLSDTPNDKRSGAPGISWSQQQKGMSNDWGSHLGNLSYLKDDEKLLNEDRLSSAGMGREQEARRHVQTPPEELLLYYKDPQGAIQGPFSGGDIIGWFEAGYFGIDLLVRLANAPSDVPFALLGDVMPHLRAKARPPPGFNAPKQNDFADAIIRPNFSTFGKVSAEIDLRSEQRHKQGSATEAENRFLESLMSTPNSMPVEKFPFSEGLHSYVGNNPSGAGLSGVDGANNYLLAKRMALERQRSMSDNPHWLGRDGVSMPPMSEIAQDPLALQPNLQPLPAESIRLPHSQSADLLPVLQGLYDRSSSGINNGIAGWSNFHAQGSLQDKVDLHLAQNLPPQTPFGIQQQRLQPSLTNLLAHGVDNSSSNLTPEKLLSSGLSHDAQLLGLLQQQRLLQLHSQSHIPAQQLSLLDELLLLKRQEEQQQLLRQQLLLSQALAEQQASQFLREPPYANLQSGAISTGNVSGDPRLQPSQEGFQAGPTIPVPTMQDERIANNVSLPSKVTKDANQSSISEASIASLLPHQILGNVNHRNNWPSPAPDQIHDSYHKEPLSASIVGESSPSEVFDRPSQQPSHPVQTFAASEVLTPVIPEKSFEKCSRSDDTMTVVTSEPRNVDSLPSEFVESTDAVPLARSLENEMSVADHAAASKVQPDSSLDEKQTEEEFSNESSRVSEAKSIEAREVRKTSEKKSRKQKSSKSTSATDQAKGSETASMQRTKQSEIDRLLGADEPVEMGRATGEEVYGTSPQRTIDRVTTVMETMGSQQVKAIKQLDSVEADFKSASEPNHAAPVSAQNTQLPSGQRAWKAAPGFKVKSLLEIQEEEQRRAQTEVAVSEISAGINSVNFSTPWAGVVASSESKISREGLEDVDNSEFIVAKNQSSIDPKSKESQLHDLLAEEPSGKSSQREMEMSDRKHGSLSQQVAAIQVETLDGENFIDARESKKNRKKSAKSKAAGSKNPAPVTSADVSVGSSAVEKGKSSRMVQQEKEVLPMIPSGPSLGDFVPWKVEATNSQPAPAWSTDSGKLIKPTSLRDILKEQETKVAAGQRQNQIPIPQKSQPVPSAHNSSWSLSASSPSKAASPLQINSSASSKPKFKEDDDLFWGPIDQLKQDTKQAEYPKLASQTSWGSKNTPVKGTPSGLFSRQKSVGVRPVEHIRSSSPASGQTSLKGKREAMNKHSEAMDFKDWCESECVRLIGTKDTSFLEYCLKQSRSEAEMLLIENLGSFDPDHEFIDKFLNYKELLPADVLEIAFESRNDRKAPLVGAGDVNSDDLGQLDSLRGPDGPSKGGSKKKGKKGKKVSPSVLGFNVVSNRIMMGEIQTVDE
ncbi:protein ESSENTIAL FOR POTEXVIRUS ACCUMULATION 1 isoform X2 [Rhodamnia argentea]|uniref:Protein ESSENTIAL FOR POTEXVIRUS ACCUMULATION 1 isoform X2 n=1 Tax=Rhodamnia argentea TaxID=178133 RepID=A0ABM3H307_9MYRT|nr:protein ESSENTIAL FOR POTEXVIRUS ACCUMULATION 1 isoform X2 [Rhodamnia argentea]